ncbi:DUF4160 domain-containing protein [Pontibacter pamirensis]|uniref:DUF4160 domain-containing protein n=1 Tax=Pontibacter pamirensis TaxID=2562824 RepID=UPI00138A3B90|nr:DUF4160 domain-containing protein [Pontibacter pamirensis]
MPEISRFYGIVIYMFYNDHNPPHFHVEYGEFKAVVSFDEEIVKGNMPKRALKLVFEWMDLHNGELMKNWELARSGEPLNKIEPLN